MKAMLLILMLCLSSLAHAQHPLTNQDVLTLIKSGLGAEVVTAKIKQSGGDFDTSPATLKQLKDAGVPESIIVAMIEASAVRPKALAHASLNTAAKPNQTEVVIKDGTRVEIELAYTVSSADLKEGDAVSFLVVNPVQVDRFMVIERGAPSTARVVKAEGGKSWARGGQLTWSIQNVTAVDGQKIPLHFTSSTKGDGKAGSMTAGIVVTGLLFWPAAPLWGFKKGKPAVIPAGKRFEVFVQGDAKVNATPAPKTSAGTPAATQQTPAKTCIFAGQEVPCNN